MKYIVPPLSYDYGALEPYIDARTMEIHHAKHHQAYVDNLNKALEKHPSIATKPLEQLLQDLEEIPADIRTAVRNNGGGHSNHTFFWEIMKKNGGGEPRGTVHDEILKAFGTFAAFQEQFNGIAKGVFGSGWAWLVLDGQGALKLHSTANQDSPLSAGLSPILGLDVWEHAYYLQYQNKRPDYIGAWWHVVNWDRVEDQYRLLMR